MFSSTEKCPTSWTLAGYFCTLESWTPGLFISDHLLLDSGAQRLRASDKHGGHDQCPFSLTVIMDGVLCRKACVIEHNQALVSASRLCGAASQCVYAEKLCLFSCIEQRISAYYGSTVRVGAVAMQVQLGHFNVGRDQDDWRSWSDVSSATSPLPQCPAPGGPDCSLLRTEHLPPLPRKRIAPTTHPTFLHCTRQSSSPFHEAHCTPWLSKEAVHVVYLLCTAYKSISGMARESKAPALQWITPPTRLNDMYK